MAKNPRIEQGVPQGSYERLETRNQITTLSVAIFLYYSWSRVLFNAYFKCFSHFQTKTNSQVNFYSNLDPKRIHRRNIRHPVVIGRAV